MLILTRKEGDTVAIGDDIMVTVLASNSGQVRLAIAAPRDVAVHREEVWRRINDEEVA